MRRAWSVISEVSDTSRKTKQNRITSEALLAQVNAENMALIADFMEYLASTQKSETTVVVYRNDLEIAFVWGLKHNDNKAFVGWAKRDIVRFQNWLVNENGNSPARVRRIKATLSSLSNFIEAVLDDIYPNFRNIIHKVESPPNAPTREKTVLAEAQLDLLLKTLADKGEHEQACMLALAMYSGRRKAELVRFKVSYFDDDNIIYGSLYKTPEPIKTKGRGRGKYIYCYTLARKFKPYMEAWMRARSARGIESEWLFPMRDDASRHMNAQALNSWAQTFSKMLGVDFYFHALRHYFTTQLVRSGLPDSVIQDIIGWSSADMLRLYTDISIDEQLGRYFDENGVKTVLQMGAKHEGNE